MAAPTVVNSAQTASSSTATLTLPSTPSSGLGRYLACFIDQTGSTTAPTLTGWTVVNTPALYAGGGTDSVWFAYKLTAGTETSIAPTAASGGTINGICYWELSNVGAPLTFDGAFIVNSLGNSNVGILTVTASNPGSGEILLMGVGQAASNGASTAWTGAGGTAVGISNVATRMQGGSFATTGSMSAAVFQANWTTSHAFGMLGVIIEGAQQFSGTATGVLSIAASTATGSPSISQSGATGSLSIIAAGTSVTFQGDMDAVPQAATFPFIPGQPQTELAGTATGALTISAGPATGTPAVSGAGNGFLSISATVVNGPTSGNDAQLTIAGTATGTVGFTQSGATGSLTVVASAAGTPAVATSGVAGTLSVVAGPVIITAGGQGLLSIATNSPVGSVSVPGILNAQMSVVATSGTVETNARGNLSIAASAVGTPSVSGAPHGVLTVGSSAAQLNTLGATLQIAGSIYLGPQGLATLVVTAATIGYAGPPSGTVGISVLPAFTVGIGATV